jgi:hypothetical protein
MTSYLWAIRTTSLSGGFYLYGWARANRTGSMAKNEVPRHYTKKAGGSQPGHLGQGSASKQARNALASNYVTFQ